jgi:hypothetical protein
MFERICGRNGAVTEGPGATGRSSGQGPRRPSAGPRHSGPASKKKPRALEVGTVVFCLGWPKRSIQITSVIQKKNGAPLKSPRRETPKSGVFLVHRRRRICFQRHKGRVGSSTSLVSEFPKKRRTRSPYPVSLLTYSIPVFQWKYTRPAVRHQYTSACK